MFLNFFLLNNKIFHNIELSLIYLFYLRKNLNISLQKFKLAFFNNLIILALKYTDYDVVARGFGGVGVKMDRSNDSEIEQVKIDSKKKF